MSFRIIVFSIATLLTLYLGWRLINPAPLSRGRKVAAWLLVAFALYVHPVLRFVNQSGLKGDAMTIINWAGYSAFGLATLLVALMIVRDLPILARRTGSALARITGRRKRNYFTRPDKGRRQFLLNATNATLLAATVPLTGYAAYEANRTPSVLGNDIPIHDLPAGLDGFAIAQISDTHIGVTLGKEWARKVVDEVNALGPDMIVHTGDMVDGTVAGLRNAVSPFADLSARHGVWFCTGNHEYYSGVFPWLRHIRELGMTPLINENRLVDTGNGKILLAGVTDYGAARMYPPHVSSPSAAMEGAQAHDVSILLAHRPRSVFEAAKAGFDIQLSGHTHGGQYFPYTLAIHLFQPYVRGPYTHEATHLYVNQGTGYWGPPMRLGTVPEITLHTLRCA
ncbi:metallophosphoesterase [Pseudodesulfovibrio sp.]|uniref:metallophosphoesterase n=1 Tax=unclassified Pseudodesulfovibrio TaxID=2661612 RepID=UPI003B001D97